MDWVFGHFQLIIAIAGGIAWWLKQRKEAQEGDSAKPSAPAVSREKTFDDPELAERTRRIREEIQRKIEQRAKGYATQQPKTVRAEPAVPRLVVRPVAAAPAEPAPVARAGASRQETQRAAEILEQQRALMEKLDEANLMKTAAEKRTVFEAATADHMAEARSQTRSTILDDLGTPDALRRAFILCEVLGPPVALRR